MSVLVSEFFQTLTIFVTSVLLFFIVTVMVLSKNWEPVNCP